MLLRKNKIFNLQSNKKNGSNEDTKHTFPSSSKSQHEDDNSSLIVGESVTIQGSIIAKNEIKIYGKVKSNVEAKKIFIGKNGSIEGSIKSNSLEIEGKAKGEIDIDDLITIFSSGKIEGKISYQKINAQEGANIKGELILKENKQEDLKDFFINKKN